MNRYIRAFRRSRTLYNRCRTQGPPRPSAPKHGLCSMRRMSMYRHVCGIRRRKVSGSLMRCGVIPVNCDKTIPLRPFLTPSMTGGTDSTSTLIPLGARADQQFTNEGNPNSDWNPVWDVRTGRFDGGWTAEMEIPFKTLRYRSGSPQVWGVQLRRSIRRKNEWVYLTRLPISAGGGRGSSGIFRVSAAGTLVGIETPPVSRNLEIKPYGIGGLMTDRSATPVLENHGYGEVGLDVKYGITQNLTADFTVNTDFAQVEVDEQQVNLTRFSLFFPEKREFFLEGRGIFEFARGGRWWRVSRWGGRYLRGCQQPDVCFIVGASDLASGRIVPYFGRWPRDRQGRPV